MQIMMLLALYIILKRLELVCTELTHWCAMENHQRVNEVSQRGNFNLESE